MKSTVAVGHGLTAALQEDSPTVGLGAETGERVAKLAPLHRTAGGSCGSGGNAQVKDQPGRARSVHQRKYKGFRVVVTGQLRMSKQLTKQEVMELILKVKNLGDRKYAEFIYHRENALHPQWHLREAFDAMKGKK